jgi:ferritin
MLSENMQKALNEHMNFELYSSYVYLSMAAWCESKDLPGFANWFKVQVKEELLHVDKFYNYIIDRDGRVLLTGIKAPEPNWESPLASFQNALDHEREVTRRIGVLVDVSLKESDHSTHNFLQWFVTEQVEEEANVKAVVQQLKLVGDSGHSLFLVDRELAQRVFVMPPTTA